MEIAGFQANDMQLIDPGARHHRPIGSRENPALKQQHPMVVVRYEQRLGQHSALDPLRAQARAPKRLGLHATEAGADVKPGIGPPTFPCRTATICARIASAVSSAVCAPMSSPIGAWTRSRLAASTPAAVSRATRSRCVFLLPMAPM